MAECTAVCTIMRFAVIVAAVVMRAVIVVLSGKTMVPGVAGVLNAAAGVMMLMRMGRC